MKVRLLWLSFVLLVIGILLGPFLPHLQSSISVNDGVVRIEMDLIVLYTLVFASIFLTATLSIKLARCIQCCKGWIGKLKWKG